jgi:hypothetical protein
MIVSDRQAHSLATRINAKIQHATIVRMIRGGKSGVTVPVE